MAIRVGDIEDMIHDHMDTQPYSCVCESCGDDLVVAVRDHDNDFDLKMSVKPCEKCLDDAYRDGSKEGYEEAEADLNKGERI